MKLTYEQILITAKFFKELSELRLPMAQLLRLRQALRFIVEKAQEFDEVRQRSRTTPTAIVLLELLKTTASQTRSLTAV